MACLSPVIKCLGLELPELSPKFEKLVRSVYPLPSPLWSLRPPRARRVQITEMFYELDADAFVDAAQDESTKVFLRGVQGAQMFDIW